MEPTAKARLVFDVPPKEKKWLEDLVKESGHKYNITLIRELLDVYASGIGFRPRPK